MAGDLLEQANQILLKLQYNSKARRDDGSLPDGQSIGIAGQDAQRPGRGYLAGQYKQFPQPTATQASQQIQNAEQNLERYRKAYNVSQASCSSLDRWASALIDKYAAVKTRTYGAAGDDRGNTSALRDAQRSSELQLAANVKLYPNIGLAALQANQAPYLRLWLVMRLQDPMGAGNCDLAALRAFLSRKSCKLAGLGWENVRKLLRKGNGRYWQLETRNGKLNCTGQAFIKGNAKVAALLGVKRLTNKPVTIPISSLRSIGRFKAALYDAWHSGRQKSKPISRQVQRQLTGIPERTQRHYCREADIKRQANIAIGNRYNQESAQDAAWQHQGAFEFYDHLGYQGKRQSAYNAWHLPVSHTGTLSQAAYGSQRKINRYLVDLAVKGNAQSVAGERLENVDKVFFDDAKQAGKAYNGWLDAYWPEQNKNGKPLTFWRVLPGVK